MSVQTFNIIRSRNCYNCHQFDHRIENCSKILKLINDDFIHFNERRRMCFNKKEQRNTKMRLIYDLFKAKIARVCLQQQLKILINKKVKNKYRMINAIMNMNEVIIHDVNLLFNVKKFSKEFADMLITSLINFFFNYD